MGWDKREVPTDKLDIATIPDAGKLSGGLIVSAKRNTEETVRQLFFLMKSVLP